MFPAPLRPHSPVPPVGKPRVYRCSESVNCNNSYRLLPRPEPPPDCRPRSVSHYRTIRSVLAADFIPIMDTPHGSPIPERRWRRFSHAIRCARYGPVDALAVRARKRGPKPLIENATSLSYTRRRAGRLVRCARRPTVVSSLVSSTLAPQCKIQNRFSDRKNRTNEATGDENVVIIQNQSPLAVAANSGVE
jgi:hypothetical protein